MKTTLLTSGIIMLLFMAMWLWQYPDVVWKSLSFQLRDTKSDVAMCVAVWVYLLASVSLIAYLASLV